MSDSVICLVCNKSFRRITRTHLKKHELTTQKYLEKYPNTQLICAEILEHNSQRMRENNPMWNEENQKKVSESLTGRIFTDEHRANIKKSAQNRTWMDDLERRQRQSILAHKILVPNAKARRADGWVPQMTEQARMDARLRMIGNTIWLTSHHNKGKKLKLTPAQRANRSAKRVNYLVNTGNLRVSSLETKFAQELANRKINFAQQHAIVTDNGSWLYDFYIPSSNMLIEIDGEYWHTTNKQLNRDKIKTQIAKDHKYRFLRLSENNLDLDLLDQTDLIIELHNSSILESRKQKLKGA